MLYFSHIHSSVTQNAIMPLEDNNYYVKFYVGFKEAKQGNSLIVGR